MSGIKVLSSAPVLQVVPNINLTETPRAYVGLDPNREVTLGDLHANSLRLLNTLIREGILKEKPGGRTIDDIYQTLQEAYYERPDRAPDEVAENACYDIFSELLEHLDVDTKACGLLRLIGDVLADRGRNDGLTLRIFQKLHQAGMPFTYIMGNHDADFFESLTKDAMPTLGASQAGSLYNARCSSKIKKEVLNKDFITENVFSHMKLIDYVIHDDGVNKTISLFTHAPVGFEVLRGLCLLYKINAPDLETLDGLITVIDEINKEFQSRGIRRFVDDMMDYVDDSHEDKEMAIQPINNLLWNREHDECDYILTLKDGVKVHYTFGHNKGLSKVSKEAKQQICIDNETGKEGAGSRFNDQVERIVQTQKGAGYPESQLYPNYSVYCQIAHPTNTLGNFHLLNDEHKCQLLETILSNTKLYQRWYTLVEFIKKIDDEVVANLDAILPSKPNLYTLLQLFRGYTSIKDLFDDLKDCKSKRLKPIFTKMDGSSGFLMFQSLVASQEQSSEERSSIERFYYHINRHDLGLMEIAYADILVDRRDEDLSSEHLFSLLESCGNKGHWDYFLRFFGLLATPSGDDKEAFFHLLKTVIKHKAGLPIVLLIESHLGKLNEAQQLEMFQMAIKSKTDDKAVLKHLLKPLSEEKVADFLQEIANAAFKNHEFEWIVTIAEVFPSVLNSKNSLTGSKFVEELLMCSVSKANEFALSMLYLCSDKEKSDLLQAAYKKALDNDDVKAGYRYANHVNLSLALESSSPLDEAKLYLLKGDSDALETFLDSKIIDFDAIDLYTLMELADSLDEIKASEPEKSVGHSVGCEQKDGETHVLDAGQSSKEEDHQSMVHQLIGLLLRMLEKHDCLAKIFDENALLLNEVIDYKADAINFLLKRSEHIWPLLMGLNHSSLDLVLESLIENGESVDYSMIDQVYPGLIGQLESMGHVDMARKVLEKLGALLTDDTVDIIIDLIASIALPEESVLKPSLLGLTARVKEKELDKKPQNNALIHMSIPCAKSSALLSSLVENPLKAQSMLQKEPELLFSRDESGQTVFSVLIEKKLYRNGPLVRGLFSFLEGYIKKSEKIEGNLREFFFTPARGGQIPFIMCLETGDSTLIRNVTSFLQYLDKKVFEPYVDCIREALNTLEKAGNYSIRAILPEIDGLSLSPSERSISPMPFCDGVDEAKVDDGFSRRFS